MTNNLNTCGDCFFFMPLSLELVKGFCYHAKYIMKTDIRNCEKFDDKKFMLIFDKAQVKNETDYSTFIGETNESE